MAPKPDVDTSGADRNPPDIYHDERERVMVSEILTDLATDHPARMAYRRGLGPLAISNLVEDRHIAKRLKLTFLDGFNRLLRRGR
jgi:hypothetical protein